MQRFKFNSMWSEISYVVNDLQFIIKIYVTIPYDSLFFKCMIKL